MEEHIFCWSKLHRRYRLNNYTIQNLYKYRIENLILNYYYLSNSAILMTDFLIQLFVIRDRVMSKDKKVDLAY